MPKATKEVKKEDIENVKLAKKTSSTKKKTTTAKANTKSGKKLDSNKNVTKKNNTKTVTTKGKSSQSTKVTTSRKTSKSSAKKKSSTSATKRLKKLESNILAEYYDLPYRYNETIVKILYQTPTILFVYWDISDDDRTKFIKKYGENFFYNTRPILKIYNVTKNYNFEVEINDFANSWYINVNDANCEYKVELARKTVKYEENITEDYISIYSSNYIEFPNDHILLDELPDNIRFKNVKNNKVSTKNISTLHLVGINKIYTIHNFYKKFYKDEILDDLNNNRIIIPSSSSWN